MAAGELDVQARRLRITEYERAGDNGEGRTRSYARRHDRRSCAAVRDSAGGLPFSVVNKALKKKEISRLINASFRRCGLRDTVIMADKLM